MTSIGVLGTGIVGRTLAARLAEVGADVMVGARTADSTSLEPFGALGVSTGSFADAAAHADLLINATNGSNSIAALESAGRPSRARRWSTCPTSSSRRGRIPPAAGVG